MVSCSRGDDQIGLRECVPGFPAGFNQQAPLEHNVLRDWSNAMFEDRAHSVGNPLFQEFSAIGFVDKFDAKAKLCQRHNADVEVLQILFFNKGRRISEMILVSSRNAISARRPARSFAHVLAQSQFLYMAKIVWRQSTQRLLA